MFSTIVLLLAAATAQPAPPPAAGTTPSPAPSAPPEILHIVTSDRHAESAAKAARPTYVVTRQQMGSAGDRTIAQALADVPGVHIYQYGPFGGAILDYGLRGSTSKQTLVLLDGLPLEDGSTGYIDLGKLSTIGVERIEVVESGASTLYGTSAIGGAINIITTVPRGTYLAAATGSLGYGDLQAGVGNGTFGGSFERQLASNNYNYPSLDGLPPGTVSNDDAQESTARFSYQGGIGSAWQDRSSFGTSSVNEGYPEGPTLPGVYGRTMESEDDLRSIISKLSPQAEFSVSLGASRQDYFDSPVPAAGLPAQEFTDGRTQVSLRNVVSGGDGTLLYGLDLGRESVVNNLGLGTTPQVSGGAEAQTALYAQYQYSFPSASEAYGGLRYEHDAPMGSVLAPAAGGILAFKRNLSLAANISEGFRVPTLDDLYFPGSSNPSLQPEKSTNYDLTLRAPNLGGGVTFGWFGRDATNLIEYVSTPTSFYYPINAQKATIRGLILTAATRPYRGMQLYTNVTNLYRASDDTPDAPTPRLTQEPFMFGTLGWRQYLAARNRFGYGIEYLFAGQHVEEVYLPPTFAPSYISRGGFAFPNAYVRYRAAPKLVASLRVDDLTDYRYAYYYGFPMPGRTFVVELATR